ncbi:MAG: hypothetical protein ACM3L9_01205 [Deltaproteobacteria bacterium]
MMFDWLARLLRIFRRQECEGARGPAEVVVRPAGDIHCAPIEALPVAVFDAVPDAGPVMAPMPSAPHVNQSRHFARQLQSVDRLNQPKSRSRPKTSVARTTKPKPVASPPALKRAANVQAGVVLSRIEQTHRRAPSAEIVDLAAVRRGRQLEPAELEAIALCS